MTLEEYDNLENYDHIFTRDFELWWVCYISPSGVILKNYDDPDKMITITREDDLSNYVVNK